MIELANSTIDLAALREWAESLRDTAAATFARRQRQLEDAARELTMAEALLSALAGDETAVADTEAAPADEAGDSHTMDRLTRVGGAWKCDRCGESRGRAEIMLRLGCRS